MRRVKTQDIVRVATGLALLGLEDERISIVKGPYGVIGMLRTVRVGLKDLGYPDKSLLNEIFQWVRILSKKYSKGRRIAKGYASDLSEDARLWYTKLGDFLEARHYFEVSPSGICDARTLLEEPHKFFTARKHWRELPKIADHDLSNACKCLAFELPTPAAIMIMRAAEAVLRKLYQAKIGKVVEGFVDWGKISNELRDLGTTKGKLVEDLNYIRRNFRNPLAHPEVTYKQREAETLLQVATRLIEEMQEEMEKA